MQVASGQLAWWVALGALYVGIVLGDLGLYGLGRAAASAPWARRFQPGERVRQGRDWMVQHVFRTVVISRFLPGARLPTYTATGFFRADFGRFAFAAAFAALGWTSMLFLVSLRIGAFLQANLGAWSWIGAGGFALTLLVVARILSRGRR